MKRKLSSLKVGDKFIVKEGYRTLLPSTIDKLRSTYVVHQIIESSHTKVVSTTSDGIQHEFPISCYGDVTDWRLSEKIAMTGPFPNGSDDQIIAYAAPVLERDPGKHEVAIYVTNMGEFVATAQIIQHPEIEDETPSTQLQRFNEENDWTLSRIGNAVLLEEDIKIDATNLGWKTGDLICASDFRCKMIDGVLHMKPKNPIVVGNFKTKEEVGQFWPASSQEDRAFLFDYESVPHFFEEKGRAKAALEPDMALVLVTKSNSGKYLNHTIIGSLGQLLYSWDDADCYFNDIRNEGLWLATNLKGWSYQSYEGEHDCGIDFDYEPATIEILEKFDLTESCITEEIRSITENEGPVVTTAAYIEKAAAASLNKTPSDDKVLAATWATL